MITQEASFADLGLADELLKACERLLWSKPTPIQSLSIPPAIEGRNVVALAETGSGKTAAYALPIIQKLLHHPFPFFALILTPTRELAAQVQAQFVALGKTIGLSAILLVGGVPVTQQADQMRISPPHVLIATPGRFVDHLKKTKGFDELKFANLRFLVIDEADRMLGADFDSVLEKILYVCPSNRQTMLFSATMTDKINKLQRASVRDPVRVSTRKSKYQSVASLRQYVYLVPQTELDAYLVHLLRVALCPELNFPGLDAIRLEPVSPANKTADSVMPTSVIVFTRTRAASNRLNLILRQFLRQPVIALNGEMPQAQRLGALHKFKRSQGAVLVATDVASRGLDIPQVGLVVNYDVPLDAKTYMHRVGRTARAGRVGCALTLLTQYSVVFFLKEIESHLLSALGTRQQQIPSLVEVGSPEDKALEKAVGNLTADVKEAAARSNQTIGTMRKRTKPSGAGAAAVFTAVDDLPTPSACEIFAKPGLKRSAWASEAPEFKRAEIKEVMQNMVIQHNPNDKNDVDSSASCCTVTRKWTKQKRNQSDKIQRKKRQPHPKGKRRI
ncbi:unnamed protein product [Calicophoron daubneyi]